MNETNIFEKASRTKLRFPIEGTGDLSVEQIWDLANDKRTKPGNRKFGFDILEEYETKIQAETQSSGSRRAQTVNAEQERNKLRLEIVTYILNTVHTEEKARAKEMAEKSAKQEKLAAVEAAIKQQEIAAISAMTREELEKLRAEIVK